MVATPSGGQTPFAVGTAGEGPPTPLVVHVPHAGTHIPAPVRRGLLLDDAALSAELAVMTDWHTDELARRAVDRSRLSATLAVNHLSRLVVDPERLPGDDEPMLEVGMGPVYTATHDGGRLREPDGAGEERLRETYLRPYREAVADAVDVALAEFGTAVVVDLHSYPSAPQPYELAPTSPRREICVGTDPAHTPPELATAVTEACAAIGLDSAVDVPFAGTYVPARHHGDERVRSVMVEIRRDTYMDEPGGELRLSHERIVGALAGCLADLALLAGAGHGEPHHH